jgi:hypothetical protein
MTIVRRIACAVLGIETPKPGTRRAPPKRRPA